MVFELIVPPANGSFCLGSENQPAGLRPVMLVKISVVEVEAGFLDSRRARSRPRA